MKVYEIVEKVWIAIQNECDIASKDPYIKRYALYVIYVLMYLPKYGTAGIRVFSIASR